MPIRGGVAPSHKGLRTVAIRVAPCACRTPPMLRYRQCDERIVGGITDLKNQIRNEHRLLQAIRAFALLACSFLFCPHPIMGFVMAPPHL